jgi:two-component system, cell cycle response regulator DivK
VNLQPAASHPRTLVLFVDDNDLIRELWTEMLSARIPGLTPAYAEDGVEAVRVAAELKPDLVVMDVEMPAMSGFDATRRLKKGHSTAGIPVIAVSGLDFHADEAVDAGCDSYMQKPLSPDQLYAEVCRVLKRTRRSS